MRCWVSMVSILAFSPGHPGDPCKIGPGPDLFKTGGSKELPHRFVLSRAMLDQQPSTFGEVRRRAPSNLPDGVEAIRAGDERFRGLVGQRRKVRIAFGDIGRIGDD